MRRYVTSLPFDGGDPKQRKKSKKPRPIFGKKRRRWTGWWRWKVFGCCIRWCASVSLDASVTSFRMVNGNVLGRLWSLASNCSTFGSWRRVFFIYLAAACITLISCETSGRKERRNSAGNWVRSKPTRNVDGPVRRVYQMAVNIDGLLVNAGGGERNVFTAAGIAM